MGMQFESVGALGTEASAGDGRLRVTFDRDQLAFFVKDELSTSDAAVGTNGAGDLRSLMLWLELAGLFRHRFNPSTIGACLNLPDQRPTREQISDQGAPPAKPWSGVTRGPEMILATFRSPNELGRDRGDRATLPAYGTADAGEEAETCFPVLFSTGIARTIKRCGDLGLRPNG
jgi:hypothetical protein